MKIITLMLLLLLVLYIDITVSNNTFMLDDNYCTSKTLSSSSNIMGFAPVASTSKTVLVKRGNTVLTSSDTYTPGETLYVYISNTDNQYMFDTSGGTFSSASVGCSYKRTTNNGASLIMPASGTVTIKAAWAFAKSTVYYNSLILQPSPSPTAAPTLAPTYVKDSPTPLPTLAPTYSPTLTPTPTVYTLVSFQVAVSIDGVSNGALSSQASSDAIKLALVNAIQSALSSGGFSNPYQLYISSIAYKYSIFRKIRLQSTSIQCTFTSNYILQQSSYPSASSLASSFTTAVTGSSFSNLVVSSLINSGVSSLSSVTSLSIPSSGVQYTSEVVVISSDSGDTNNNNRNNTSNNLKVIVAVTISVGMLLVATGLYFFWFQHKDPALVFEKEMRNIRILYIISIALGLASLILVSKWAKENDYSSSDGDTNYLGSLDWKKNIFAWHPVLMVGGFFVAQILAPAMWVFFPDSHRLYAKGLHVLLQTGGVITVALGLYAATSAKSATSSPHIVSLHSWIGVAAIASFLLNYIFGAIMRQLSMTVAVGKGIMLVQIHRKVGMIVLGVTVASILTGISSTLPQGVCNYTNSVDGIENSLANYMNIPLSCRLANGLGLLVVGSAIFVVIAIVKRYRILNHDSTDNSSVVRSPMYMTTVACGLSLASLILVSKWAKENDYSSSDGDTNYLGSLDWKKNIFAWHPVLMVGGFFVAQILAPAMWVFFPESHRLYAKGLHVLLQTGGVITVALGLYAATSAKSATSSPHIVSLHSWIGVAAVCLYSTNYLIGFGMAIVGRNLGKRLDLLHNHKLLGFLSLALSVFAIVTGIATKIIRGSCDQSNTSCNIANSTGIIVIIAAIFTVNVGIIRIVSKTQLPSENKVIIPTNNIGVVNYKTIPNSSTDFRPSASLEIESNTKFNDWTIPKHKLEDEENNNEGNKKEQSYLAHINPVSWFSN